MDGMEMTWICCLMFTLNWFNFLFETRYFFKDIFYIGLTFRDTPSFCLQSLWHKINFDLVFLTPHLVSAMLMLQVLGRE